MRTNQIIGSMVLLQFKVKGKKEMNNTMLL